MPKVRPGDPVAISAATWNDVLDAAALAKESKRAGAGLADGLAPGEIRVRNDSGSDLPRYAAVTVAHGIGVTPKKNESAFVTDTPVFLAKTADETEGSEWAVLQEPLAAGAIGRALLTGVTRAKVGVVDASDGFAEPVPGGGGSIQTCAAGSARILWKEGSTGEVWALLHLGAAATANATPEVCPAVVRGCEAGLYTVDLYANGILAGKTGSAKLVVPEVSMLSPIPSGTIILAHLVNAATADHE